MGCDVYRVSGYTTQHRRNCTAEEQETINRNMRTEYWDWSEMWHIDFNRSLCFFQPSVEFNTVFGSVEYRLLIRVITKEDFHKNFNHDCN